MDFVMVVPKRKYTFKNVLPTVAERLEEKIKKRKRAFEEFVRCEENKKQCLAVETVSMDRPKFTTTRLCASYKISGIFDIDRFAKDNDWKVKKLGKNTCLSYTDGSKGKIFISPADKKITGFFKGEINGEDFAKEYGFVFDIIRKSVEELEIGPFKITQRTGFINGAFKYDLMKVKELIDRRFKGILTASSNPEKFNPATLVVKSSGEVLE